MKKMHKILVGIAIIQLTFLLLSVLGRKDLSHYTNNKPMLSFAEDDIAKIQIKTQERTVNIVNNSNEWILPDYHQFPAQTGKVTDLLKHLLALKKPLPVGKTAIFAKQFKTTPAESDKQIHLFNKEGNIVHKIYIGTSPSFKKVHMRIDTEQETYLLPFDTHRIHTDEKSWRDDNLLQQEQHQISKITLNAFELVNDNNTWRLSDLTQTEEMASDEVQQLLSQITQLRFDDVLGNQDRQKYQQQKPDLTFSITTHDKQENYQFFTSDQKDYYVLKTSRYPFYFKVNKSKLTALKNIKRKKLVKEKTSSPAQDKKEL